MIFTVPRLLYCAFGCVLGGAVLDGAALGCALALVCFFFLGAVSGLGVAGGAIVSCWASASPGQTLAGAFSRLDLVRRIPHLHVTAVTSR